MSSRVVPENLLDTFSWTTDIEYKRWLLTEFAGSQKYNIRLKMLLRIAQNYFEHFYTANQSVEAGVPLQHCKLMKNLIKDYLHTRWTNFDDESKSDPLIYVKISHEFCSLFKSCPNSLLSSSIFFTLFTIDRNSDKFCASADVEMRSDLHFVLITALSYPAHSLLEAASILVRHVPSTRSIVDFRTGAKFFHEVCHMMPNGAKLLSELPETCPNFALYLIYCIARKFANKLRCVAPTRTHTQTSHKFDSIPSKLAMGSITYYLKNYPDHCSKHHMTQSVVLPDINHGETRELIIGNVSPIDDLITISLGFGLWLQDITDLGQQTELSCVFSRFHSSLLDVLLTQEATENKNVAPKAAEVEEGEEIELGELVDNEDQTSEALSTSPENTCPLTKYLNFVVRVHSLLGSSTTGALIADTMNRFSEIVMALYRNHSSFTPTDFENLKAYHIKLPRCKLLDLVVSRLQKDILERGEHSKVMASV